MKQLKTTHKCKKCGWKLLYIPPSPSLSHCGTDYWTNYGDRRFRPKICMACRTKIGRKAQQAQQESYSTRKIVSRP